VVINHHASLESFEARGYVASLELFEARGYVASTLGDEREALGLGLYV